MQRRRSARCRSMSARSAPTRWRSPGTSCTGPRGPARWAPRRRDARAAVGRRRAAARAARRDAGRARGGRPRARGRARDAGDGDRTRALARAGGPRDGAARGARGAVPAARARSAAVAAHPGARLPGRARVGAAHGALEPGRVHLDRVGVRRARRQAIGRARGDRAAAPTPAWGGSRSGSTRRPRRSRRRPRSSPTSRSSWPAARPDRSRHSRASASGAHYNEAPRRVIRISVTYGRRVS